MRAHWLIAAVLISGAVNVPHHAQAQSSGQDIDLVTGKKLYGGTSLGYWYYPSTWPLSLVDGAFPTGQTFTVPDNAPVLDSFSFFVYSNLAWHSPETQFRAFLMKWVEIEPWQTHWVRGRTSGPILYASGAMQGASGVAAGSSEPPQQYTFSTGGIRLTPGDLYAAFLMPVVGPPPTPEPAAPEMFGSEAPALLDEYAGGQRLIGSVLMDALNPPALDASLFNSRVSWFGEVEWDGAFTAHFTPVVTPEPASAALIGTGLVALLAAARRRSRKARV